MPKITFTRKPKPKLILTPKAKPYRPKNPSRVAVVNHSTGYVDIKRA